MHSIQKVNQFAVSIREAVTKQNLFRNKLGFGFEFRQCVRKGHTREVSLEIGVLVLDHYGSRLTVSYVVSSLVPLELLRLSGDTHPLPLLIQTSRLCKVHNVKFYLLVSEMREFWKLNRKIEPLVMAFCICINTHVQVIFVCTAFNNIVEVTRFEVRIEL